MRNDVAPVCRMLAPLRSDLAAAFSFVVPLCRTWGLLRSKLPALRILYGAAAQIRRGQSLNLYGTTAQLSAVL